MTCVNQGYILKTYCLKGCDFSNYVIFSDMAKGVLKKLNMKYWGIFQEYETYKMNNTFHAVQVLSCYCKCWNLSAVATVLWGQALMRGLYKGCPPQANVHCYQCCQYNDIRRTKCSFCNCSHYPIACSSEATEKWHTCILMNLVRHISEQT